ncbi:histidine kinase [uncultured Tenacibaculum sp.]|uniref:sensor histidine kinase n=1 Tax=uncultured Tenacibaculum sp. TaxID=174713 RepID=UPI00261CF2B3|nr:histidine kinase [uncultured Tenacibaculum sp.]
MKQLLNKIELKEWLFQILLLIVIFFLFSFDKHSPDISLDTIVFFMHYALISYIISYVFIPYLFYKKKYKEFGFAIVLTLVYLYISEEFVLEKIFYADKRGKYISNIFFTLLDILPTIVILVGFKLGWDAHKKQVLVDKLKSTVKESELRFLKSQINPHFLFNNLNNLYAYAIEQSPKTPSIILELSSVLRYMLYDCKEDFVLLQSEIEHLKHFTALNELQIENRGEVTFNTSEIPANYIIAPLILLMFIENAFKHSTASQSTNICIKIDIQVNSQGMLNFVCENSFLSNSNNQNLSKGIGLTNVNKRLEMLYPQKYTLEIDNSNQKYKVNLQLQLAKRE